MLILPKLQNWSRVVRTRVVRTRVMKDFFRHNRCESQRTNEYVIREINDSVISFVTQTHRLINADILNKK